jgi:tetratricopeptide (TPR) repeat protein
MPNLSETKHVTASLISEGHLMNQEYIEGLLQNGKVDDAIVNCNCVLQVTPNNARVLGLLGMCYYRKQEYATALEHFRRATLLDPKFVDAGLKHAQCLDRLRRYEEAYEVAKEWHRIQPSNNMLKSLTEALQQHSRGTYQGWERTAALNTTVRFGGEQESA